MVGAFQRNAFQNNAFQVDVLSVVDTATIPLPINCVLNGDQHYLRIRREYDERPPSLKSRLNSQASGVAILSKSASSYSVKVSSRGYD